MQEVSEKWKNAHRRTILGENFVEVSLDISDPDALADAEASDNGAIYLSDSLTLTNGVDKFPTPYCTLEQNLWVLDGNRETVDIDTTKDEGYVGDVLSDETCVFSDKMPTITLDFSKAFTSLIPAVTITWSNTYNEFATELIVRAYNGDELVAEKEILDNRSIKTVVLVDIVNYDRIVIYVKKWCLPHHRARIEKVFVGLNKVYTKSDLFDYSHSQSVSPVSTTLPKNEIRFSIDNTDGEYNPYNEGGLAKYLMARQEVKARYGLKLNDGTTEWVKGGTFYLSEWSAKQNGMTADFAARDLLEFMSTTYIDTHNGTSQRSLYDLAEMILTLAELPLNSEGDKKWQIDSSLKSKYTTAPLPEDTLANCLQLIANAGECVIYQDRDGVLHIEPLKFDETDYAITGTNSYSKSEITLSKQIKQVDVKVYTYTLGEKGIESDTTTKTIPVNPTGEIITVDNPLVTTDEMATSLGNWMATHLGHRMTLDSSWRADVRLDALDIVTNENSYNSNRVRMTDVEFKYNGAFRGTGKGKVI
jgi:hypothetical protein